MLESSPDMACLRVGFLLTFQRSSRKLPILFGIQQELPFIQHLIGILLPVSATGISQEMRAAESG